MQSDNLGDLLSRGLRARLDETIANTQRLLEQTDRLNEAAANLKKIQAALSATPGDVSLLADRDAATAALERAEARKLLFGTVRAVVRQRGPLP